jgi:hypothetical protein
VPPVAVKVVLYELPTSPAPRLIEWTERPTGATVIETCPEADWGVDPLSVTVTLKAEVPLAVGVPDITPALESVSPAGKLPEARDQV